MEVGMPSKDLENEDVPANAVIPAADVVIETNDINQSSIDGVNAISDTKVVRKSGRTCKSVQLNDEQELLKGYIRNKKEDGIEVKEDDGKKGRGIITTRPFKRKEYVMEYVGDLISAKEAAEREWRYSQDSSIGCYMYYFTYNDKPFCIDATQESIYKGRLVNHLSNESSNISPKIIEVDGTPHLVFIAKKDIEKGDDLGYDYGDRSKKSIKHFPWLAKKK